MNKIIIDTGIINTKRVEIVNRQKNVEYKELDTFVDEQSARASAGNIYRGTYEHSYSGYYFERANAINRLEKEIKKTEEKLKELKFCLKVTKKKEWVKIK